MDCATSWAKMDWATSWAKMGWATSWATFFTNSSGHPLPKTTVFLAINFVGRKNVRFIKFWDGQKFFCSKQPRATSTHPHVSAYVYHRNLKNRIRINLWKVKKNWLKVSKVWTPQNNTHIHRILCHGKFWQDNPIHTSGNFNGLFLLLGF
jgi:hypothetical protein